MCYVYACLCVYGCIPRAVLEAPGRGHRIPWNLSYRQSGAAVMSGCWEFNLDPLEEQPVALNN